jgi:hypothetical protein
MTLSTRIFALCPVGFLVSALAARANTITTWDASGKPDSDGPGVRLGADYRPNQRHDPRGFGEPGGQPYRSWSGRERD